MFFVFIILLYNKNKVFVFHFFIFDYFDASLKFGERRHTSFFFKYAFSSLFLFLFFLIPIFFWVSSFL